MGISVTSTVRTNGGISAPQTATPALACSPIRQPKKFSVSFANVWKKRKKCGGKEKRNRFATKVSDFSNLKKGTSELAPKYGSY